jgi:hypothetical protein
VRYQQGCCFSRTACTPAHALHDTSQSAVRTRCHCPPQSCTLRQSKGWSPAMSVTHATYSITYRCVHMRGLLVEAALFVDVRFKCNVRTQTREYPVAAWAATCTLHFSPLQCRTSRAALPNCSGSSEQCQRGLQKPATGSMHQRHECPPPTM